MAAYARKHNSHVSGDWISRSRGCGRPEYRLCGPCIASSCAQRDMLSLRRSFIGTYWPDLILPTTLPDSGGSVEDRTMARSVAANGRDAENGTGFGTETLDGSAPAGAARGVTVSGTGLATVSMGGGGGECPGKREDRH